MTQTKAISVGVLAFGLVLGVVWGLTLTFGSATHATEQITSRIDALVTEIDRTAQQELAQGCVEMNVFGQKEFCGESKEKMDALHEEIMTAIRAEKVRSAREVAEVKANIRTVTGNSNLELRFDTKVSNPYTDAIDHSVEYYRDPKGTYYMVDPQTNKVVMFTYNDHFVTPEDKKLSQDELRATARTYLAKHVEDFDTVEKTYTLEEGSKGDMYVLRYNAPEAVAGEGMLPFVQAKISTGGELVGFGDIRSLYR